MNRKTYEALPKEQDIGIKYFINHKRMRLHWHEELEIIYFERGSAEVCIDSKTYTFDAGDILVINSCEAHHGIFLSDDTKHYVLHISTKMFNSINEESKKVTIFENKITDNSLVEMLSSIFSIFEKEYPYKELYIKKYAYEFLIALTRNYIKSTFDINSKSSYKNNQYLLNEILDYLHKNCAEQISVKDLAAKFHISESLLFHLFKANMKTTIVSYVNKLRIENSKKLLLSSELNISEIASEAGFSDINYYSRTFKKIMGESPSDYRKRLLN